MDDFCDLTPPSSPEIKTFVNSATEALPLFSCKGIVHSRHNLSSDGYLVSGAFGDILQTSWKHQNNECCVIFGMTYVTTSLVSHSETVFLLAKKRITELQSRALKNSQCFHVRKELYNFLHSLKRCLQALSDVPVLNVDLIRDFLNRWKGFLLFVGRLSDLPEHVIETSATQTGLNVCHLFHLSLEVWWSAVEIIHIIDICLHEHITSIETIYSRPVIPTFSGIFAQVVLTFMWDLCYLSVQKYNHLQISDYFNVTPFTCTCTYELWMMIIHLIEFRNRIKKEESFSMYIHYIFQSILPSAGNVMEGNEELQLDTFLLKPEGFECVNPVNFCFWMLTHISSLCKYDSNGNFAPSMKVFNNYFGMQHLLHQVVNAQTEHRNEAQLRCILQSCCVLAETWDSNPDLIVPFIEFFMKKLDDFFHQRPGLEELPVICRTGEAWVEDIKRRISTSQCIKQTDSSFHIFLRLLSLTLRKSGSESIGIWKQLRGRIYSKFHSRRIKDLSEMGLYNSLTIFIVLALSAELEDVTSKMCDLADIIQKGSDSKKQIIAWKSIFALITIYQDNKKDAFPIMQRIASYFHNVCMIYGQNENQHHLMPLVQTYLEGVQNIVESSSNLTCHEYCLTEKGFDVMLLKCSENEISHFLTVTECILKKIYELQVNRLSGNNFASSLTEEYLRYINNLCDQVLPFLHLHVTKETVLPQCTTICSFLTQLSVQVTSASSKPLFSQLFHYFGTNFKVNPTVTCEYLCLLLQDKQISGFLTEQHYKAAVKSWFRCGISILPPSEKMQQLTQLIFQPSQSSHIVSLLKEQCSFSNHDDIMINFFCKVSKALGSQEEMIQARNDLQYFLQDFVAVLPGLLKTVVSKEMIFYIYNVCGHLVEHCAPLLYVKSNSDSLLVSLINEIILPRTLYVKDKGLPKLLCKAISTQLTSFLCGIIKVNFMTDNYLQRKLKELILQYLSCFEVKQLNPQNVHPLLSALLRLPPTATEFFLFAVETIKDNVIKKGLSSSCFLVGMSVINGLFCHLDTTSKEVIFPKVLPSLLEILLVTDDHPAYQKLLETVSLMLKLCEREFDPSFRQSVLLVPLNTFLENNLAWKVNRVFKVIGEITASHRELLADLIPVVSKQVQIIEEKRGIGHDVSLRNGLTGLLKQLNDKPVGN